MSKRKNRRMPDGWRLTGKGRRVIIRRVIRSVVRGLRRNRGAHARTAGKPVGSDGEQAHVAAHVRSTWLPLGLSVVSYLSVKGVGSM